MRTSFSSERRKSHPIRNSKQRVAVKNHHGPSPVGPQAWEQCFTEHGVLGVQLIVRGAEGEVDGVDPFLLEL